MPLTQVQYGMTNTLVSGVAQNSTSGTSIDFTGIPSGVKRITVMFNGISTNGTSSAPLIQLGSGSVTTTGYTCVASYCGATNAAGGGAFTTGFGFYTGSAANLMYGHAVLTLLGSNTWVCSGTIGLNSSGTYYGFFTSGTSPALSGTLDRVRITTANGTDTFDAGSINILYE